MVSQFLLSGQKLPNLPTVNDRLIRLRDFDYVNSVEHTAQQCLLDRRDVPSLVVEFERRFIALAAKEGIPLHCANRIFDKENECSVSIVHSQYGLFIAVADWEIIARFGYAAMRAVPGLSCDWIGTDNINPLPNMSWWDLWYDTDSKSLPVKAIR